MTIADLAMQDASGDAGSSPQPEDPGPLVLGVGIGRGLVKEAGRALGEGHAEAGPGVDCPLTGEGVQPRAGRGQPGG